MIQNDECDWLHDDSMYFKQISTLYDRITITKTNIIFSVKMLKFMRDILTEIPIHVLECKTLTLELYNGLPIQYNYQTNSGEGTTVFMFMLSERHPICLRSYGNFVKI